MLRDTSTEFDLDRSAPIVFRRTIWNSSDNMGIEIKLNYARVKKWYAENPVFFRLLPLGAMKDQYTRYLLGKSIPDRQSLT